MLFSEVSVPHSGSIPLWWLIVLEITLTANWHTPIYQLRHKMHSLEDSISHRNDHRALDYWDISMFMFMLVDTYFLTWLLIGWQLCCRLIRSHVWKLWPYKSAIICNWKWVMTHNLTILQRNPYRCDSLVKETNMSVVLRRVLRYQLLKWYNIQKIHYPF